MADDASFDPSGNITPVSPKTPPRTASPGLEGAIRDAVAAVSKAFAPKSITQRGKKVDQAINQDSGGLADQLNPP